MGNYDKAACALGRLVIVCRYLKHDYTLQAMRESLNKIDAALNVMDGSPIEGKPTDMNVTYRKAHQEWFDDMWKKGIAKLKQYIVAGAEHLRARERDAEFQKLPQETKDKVDDILNPEKKKEVLAEFCPPEDFAWPTGTL